MYLNHSLVMISSPRSNSILFCAGIIPAPSKVPKNPSDGSSNGTTSASLLTGHVGSILGFLVKKIDSLYSVERKSCIG